MSDPSKVVATFSGGMDSTTLLYYLRDQGQDVYALSIDYGQRHSVELEHAANVVERLGVQHHVLDLKSMAPLMAGSSQTDQSVEVPLGHYAEDNMKATVVPNRNMILLAVAGAWAISLKAKHVAYAAHAGDHTIYPDCREEFATTMAQALSLADWHEVDLVRPFVAMSKADIVKVGADLGVPFELTWSCYQGGEHHCGACGTCIERREAFMAAGVPDPTIYAEGAPDLSLASDGSLDIDWGTNPESKVAVNQ